MTRRSQIAPRRGAGRQRRGLFITWAGDSFPRRILAWLGQTAILIAAAAVAFAIIWLVLLPLLVNNFVETTRNTTP